MGKKIEALKRAFPRPPKISIPKIPKISKPRISASDQLFILAMVWLIGVGLIGSSVVVYVSGSLLLGFVLIAAGLFCFLWFKKAALKLHGDVELW